MNASRTRTLLALGLATIVGACARNSSTYEMGGDVAMPAYPPATLESRELNLLRHMSDANILGKLIQIDSFQVAAADTAARLTKNSDVYDHARLMHLKYGDNMKALDDLGAVLHIVPTVDVEPFTDSPEAAAVDSVRRVREAMIDAQFVHSQVSLQQHLLAELEVLHGVAQRPQVRDAVDDMLALTRNQMVRLKSLADRRQIGR